MTRPFILFNVFIISCLFSKLNGMESLFPGWIIEEDECNSVDYKTDYYCVENVCDDQDGVLTDPVVIDPYQCIKNGKERMIAYGMISRVYFAPRLKPTTDETRENLIKEISQILSYGDKIINTESITLVSVGATNLFPTSDNGIDLDIQAESIGILWHVEAQLLSQIRYRITIFQSTDGIRYVYKKIASFIPDKIIVESEILQRELVGSLKIVSYNLWNTMPERNFPKYKERFEFFIKNLLEAEGDVLTIQEVRYDPRLPADRCQICELTKQLATHGYGYYVFQPAMKYEDGSHEGVAIISKYPIIDSSYMLLGRDRSNPMDVHQRIALHARIMIANKKSIDVFTSHFSLSEETQIMQVDDILTFADSLWSEELQGQFITGDLNAEPHSIPMRQLFTGNYDKEDHKQFRDTFLELYHEPLPRATSMASSVQHFTFPTMDPKKRIDYIAGRGPFVTIQYSVFGDKKKPKQNTGLISLLTPSTFASDHRGVVATLSWARTNRPTLPPLDTCVCLIEGTNQEEDTHIPTWSAQFDMGAYSAMDEHSGFRSAGVRNLFPVSVTVSGAANCEAILFASPNFSGHHMRLPMGTHIIKEVGWLKPITAILIRQNPDI